MLPPNRVFATYSDDTAALETDTMRFLAILSICLMAIFALIESIPETAGRESVAVEMPEDLLRRAEELRVRIEMLLGEANELTDVITELGGRTAQGQDGLASLAERMQTMEQWLEVQDAKLERVMARVASRQEQLRALARRVRSAEATVKTSAERIEDAREAAREEIGSDQIPEALAQTQPSPPKPLSLRFDTTDAMESLVRQGKVHLFAQLSGSVWRASTTLAFNLDELPGSNVYLVVDSVGERLNEAFKRTLVTTRKPEWYVVFDAGIAAGISGIVRQHRHGSVVVAGDGAVFHAP